jgi:hypothetical protein
MIVILGPIATIYVCFDSSTTGGPGHIIVLLQETMNEMSPMATCLLLNTGS